MLYLTNNTGVPKHWRKGSWARTQDFEPFDSRVFVTKLRTFSWARTKTFLEGSFYPCAPYIGAGVCALRSQKVKEWKIAVFTALGRKGELIIATSTYTSISASFHPSKLAKLTLFSLVPIRYLSEDGIRDFKFTERRQRAPTGALPCFIFQWACAFVVVCQSLRAAFSRVLRNKRQ